MSTHGGSPFGVMNLSTCVSETACPLSGSKYEVDLMLGTSSKGCPTLPMSVDFIISLVEAYVIIIFKENPFFWLGTCTMIEQGVMRALNVSHIMSRVTLMILSIGRHGINSWHFSLVSTCGDFSNMTSTRMQIDIWQIKSWIINNITIAKSFLSGSWVAPSAHAFTITHPLREAVEGGVEAIGLIISVGGRACGGSNTSTFSLCPEANGVGSSAKMNGSCLELATDLGIGLGSGLFFGSWG